MVTLLLDHPCAFQKFAKVKCYSGTELLLISYAHQAARQLLVIVYCCRQETNRIALCLEFNSLVGKM